MIRGLDPTLFAGLFLLSTFIAAAVVGLAGFAFGLVASGIWLYILSPVQTATMILAFGFLVQSYAVWVQRERARLAAHLADGPGLGVRHPGRHRDPERPPIPRICVSA